MKFTSYSVSLIPLQCVSSLHRSIGLSNSQQTLSGHYQSPSETSFEGCFAAGAIVAHFYILKGRILQ